MSSDGEDSEADYGWEEEDKAYERRGGRGERASDRKRAGRAQREASRAAVTASE